MTTDRSRTQMTLRTDRALAHAERRSSHFVVAEIRARSQAPRVDRTEVDLGIALDRSGSMYGEKHALTLQGVVTSVRMLRETDRFSLVTFNHKAEVEAPHAFATDEHKTTALELLRRVQPSGNTDLFGGFLRAAHEVAGDMREDRLARVLLLTDGQTNAGVTDPDEIVRHVEQLRLRGLITSTVGVGAHFNESLLKAMAAAGGGNSYFVEHAEQIPDVLSGEVGDALSVTEHDVELEVRVPDGVRVEPMDRSRMVLVPGGLRLSLGDLVSDQVVRVVFEVSVPSQHDEPSSKLEFVLRARSVPVSERRHELEFKYVDTMTYHAQPVDHELLGVVYETFSARARREAAQLNADHRYHAAREVMTDAFKTLTHLAQGDPRAIQYLNALRNDAERHGQRMDPIESKRRMYDADHRLRDRDDRGRPRRGDRS